jgi:GxxExxY protein
MGPHQTAKLYYEAETYAVIGICMSVHRELGPGLLEISYKDAIEFDLKQQSIKYGREREYAVTYKGVILKHKFYADFVVNDQIILEVKANEGGFADFEFAQTINYLKISGCKIGLLVNFGRPSLEHKRLAL